MLITEKELCDDNHKERTLWLSISSKFFHAKSYHYWSTVRSQWRRLCPASAFHERGSLLPSFGEYSWKFWMLVLSISYVLPLSVCQYLGIKRGIRLIRTVAVENTDLFLSIGDADNLVITEFLWFNFNPVSNVTWRIDLRIKTSMLCTSHRNCFSTMLPGVLIFFIFQVSINIFKCQSWCTCVVYQCAL